MATGNIEAFEILERAQQLSGQVIRAMKFYKDVPLYKKDKEYRSKVDVCQKPFEDLANYIQERCK